MNEGTTLYLSNTIDTGYRSHLSLGKFATELFAIEAGDIFLDFSSVNFIASNQFAILGCLLDTYRCSHPECAIYISPLKNQIKKIIQKNGFCLHLGFEKLPDTYNTVIPYTIFTTDQIIDFEKYILMRIFDRSDLPKMSVKLRGLMIDAILEIFNNVKEHTKSDKVYTCGQFFPKSSLLYLTIVDSGETIPYNVHKHFSKINRTSPFETIKWALVKGNTTRISNTPGGLGLSLIDDFITINEGRLYIVSGNETYERIKSLSRHKQMSVAFPGTIVTVAFNLSDTSNVYHMTSEDSSEIRF